MDVEVVQFKKLRGDAIVPVRSTEFAAGFDLFAVEDVKIVAGAGYIPVKTGIAVQLPAGHYGKIAPRSGLAVNYSIDVGAGVVDIDYKGELIVLIAMNRLIDLNNFRVFDREKSEFSTLKLTTKDLIFDSNTFMVKKDGWFINPIIIINPEIYYIEKGQKIAKLIIEKASYAGSVVVEEFSREYSEHAGFGSTGF